jgi:predicted HAD superfamily Cof-like phosphohydrolase
VRQDGKKNFCECAGREGFNVHRRMNEFHQGVMEIKSPVSPTLDIPIKIERLGDRLISEELSEYFEAKAKNDIVKVADALGDLVVVICQTALQYGIDLDAVLNEIHDSNMSKRGGIKDSTGKLQKPSTYREPDLQKVLFPNHEKA